MRNPGSAQLVSLILAVRNEVQFVESAIQSLLEQEAEGLQLELLVVDGMSTDGTREKITMLSRKNPQVRLIDNPARNTPSAFNAGLRQANGMYVCILGAHTLYDRDYVAKCLQELLAKGAAACGGRVITAPANDSLQARLCAWAIGHPFGSSGKSFRTQPEGYAPTVNYPVLVRSAVLEQGGYDERLLRNQDLVLNQKLVDSGHKVFCTWKTSCRYFARPTVWKLMEYAFRNSYWNIISLRVKRSAMQLFHFVPLFFVLVLVGLASVVAATVTVLPRVSLIALVALAAACLLHLACGSIAGISIALREKAPAALLLAAVFFLFHLAYGAGILAAIVSNAKTRPQSSSSPVSLSSQATH